MHRTYVRVAGPLLCFVTLGLAVAAQQPRIANGRVSSQQAGTNFGQAFRSLVSQQTEVAWVGYAVPVVEGNRSMCCGGSGTVWISGSVISSDGRGCCTACDLEPASSRENRTSVRAPQATGPIPLEAADRMVVLFRVVDRRVERIRIFSEDCELDAGGRPVTWLENVRPADSVDVLESYAVQAEGERSDRITDGAVSAIALHQDAAADAALERLVAPAQPDSVRKKVTFWLGNARGARGLALLQRVLRDDPSIEVRKGAVFGVSQSREPGAFDMLASIARSDSTPRIRGEALFWLSQKDDQRAAGIILETLEKDAASEVRKKAVFALSQLKDNAGVEALVRVARENRDPSTRGEAIFWLGQKAGARASAAITERIEQDPDTEVKKKAVFALSQLPKDEGVPLLIQVARTNANPAVRKQAMFWLGQSKDPRAIDFFAEVLK